MLILKNTQFRVLMVLTATGLQKWILEDSDTARQVGPTFCTVYVQGVVSI